MTATVHILWGPSGSGKTRRLCEVLRDTDAAPGATLWIGPSQRALETVRTRLLSAGVCDRWPRLLTFQDFAEEILRTNDPTARPLSHAQRRLLVETVIEELHARGELSWFGRVAETRGFSEAVFALLAELKRHEVWPSHLRDALAGVGLRVTECARIYSHYQQHLIRHRLYDLEGRIWYAGDLLRRGNRRPFEAVRCVILQGFAALTRSQRQVLQALTTWIESIWLALPGEKDSSRPELFLRSTTTLRQLKKYRPRIEETNRVAMLPFDGEPLPARPAGLRHLERQLFRPLAQIERSDDADGLLILESPGPVGECRRVARHVKTLLLDGVRADDIVVTLRDVEPYADLLREVFDEYGLPYDVEGIDPLTRDPTVAVLLRAVRLPDDGWPFGPVAALLRSGWFRPNWSVSEAALEMPLHAEALLRLIGEPRDREAYLAAVRRWAEDPPAALEDEDAEESRRQRTNQLAILCRAFLERFFHAWDDAPREGLPADHVAWLERWAADLGFLTSDGEQPGLRRFFDELRRWERLELLVREPGRPLSRREFLRRLLVLGATAGMPRSIRGPGRVRVLSAELARHVECDHLFVLGLGERSFPRLAPPEPFLDESQRQRLQQARLDIPSTADLLPEEMLLFYETVTRPRRRLVLSYPAVDERGQELLPSSFLNLVRECFESGTVPVERRSMLLEGLDRDNPLSPAEHRVRLARAGERDRLPIHLATAADVVQRRLHDRDHGPYDGLFRSPDVIAAVGRLFHAERVFSPTALEDYVACPFKFFLRHGLRLEELEEPREEIEVTRRGQAFHRALSRLHQRLKETGRHQPTDEVDEQVLKQLEDAVGEYAARAASPASKVLWRLEGQRLARAGRRYRSHWQKFLSPWKEVKVTPRPHFFEIDFGLPGRDGAAVAPPLVLRHDDVEIRISGRIDRVDFAETEDGVGFWIIDYKTGRSANYTGTDLREFRKLQLTLYALAVEQVLLQEHGARPLGLAYWMVTDGGPKVALPGRDTLEWFRDAKRWDEVRGRLQEWVVALVTLIRQGVFPLQPRSDQCTETCSFSQICRISQSRWVEKSWNLPLPD